MADKGASLSAESDVIFDLFCEMCIEDDKQLEAECFCEDCREYLCGSCYSAHQKTRFTRHHVLQDKTSMPKDTPLSQDRANKDIVTKCKKHSGEPVKHEVRCTKVDRPPSSPSPSNVTATKLADIDVTSPGEHIPNRITGSVVMNDDKLIIVDARYNKLKLINTNTNALTATLDLHRDQPWDVAVINQQLAVVTLPYRRKLLFFMVTDTMVMENKVAVRGQCHGVAYSQSKNRLLITLCDKPRLWTLDLRGAVIRTIEKDSEGRPLWEWPQYVCVSKDGETVYVSDHCRSTVTSLTLDGVVKAVYKDEELRGAEKVCTDHHGNVYVCGLISQNVHMLTADLRKVKVILTRADGLDNYVWSVSHCQDTNRLFIGMCSNTVKSYQLS